MPTTDQVDKRTLRMDHPPHVRVAIIGSGFAGLAMAIQLKRRGIDDFAVLERAGEIGGAWRDNTYPGCACDVPSTLYSFSFAANPHWTSSFSPQQEIHQYLQACVHRFGLRGHLRLRHEVLAASWDVNRERWSVVTSGGTFTATVLVSATGQLSEPMLPPLPGLERFTGAAFHTSRWDHSLDLTGSKVAVIGTGASTVQLVPAIADRVAALHVFQRTAAWVLPQRNRRRSTVERRALRMFPWLQHATRATLHWGRELALLGFVHPGIMRTVSPLAGLHLRRQVPQPALRAELTPTYAMGCKPVLRSSTFYPTLSREPPACSSRWSAGSVRRPGAGTRRSSRCPAGSMTRIHRLPFPLEIRSARPGTRWTPISRSGPGGPAPRAPVPGCARQLLVVPPARHCLTRDGARRGTRPGE